MNADEKSHPASKMLDESTLNDYSRRFAEMLFDRFPGWRRYAGLVDRADTLPGAMLVEVSAPSPNQGRLAITTEDDEITVGFDEYHTHFGRFEEPEAETFRNALQFIQGIVEEKLVVVVVVNLFGQFGRSYCLEPGERPTKKWHERFRVRSWNGTYDRG